MGDQDAKMRKEIKNAKAKHGLNSKIWIRANLISFLRDQNVREEEKRKREKKRKRKRRRREERKKERSSSKAKKVWNYMEF